ncbi:MAG: folylpolyglutamate synthase/dihydrofolate synthase family protein [Xanthomonadales bacterium]|jgi:dihydrofolate synthase/folylpolyglutamate synthase|nr:folylpolyglutamate synthase/dihydrofolate synthase family protein [Xanthomonadales bacterium]
MRSPDPGSPALKRWLTRLESRHDKPIDLGLGRCGAVYRRLGSPRPGRHVITVAGTNGKGSTVAWAAATLSLLGKRQGTYTSPHLLRFNERVRIDGVPVDSATLVDAFEAVEAARQDTSLTYFEFTTLACFLVMSRADLDVAVLEVGLGGRLDTVNLVDADVAVITPIGLDHQAYLGEDRYTIGREKAGILREGITLVTSEPHPPLSVLEDAELLGCRVLRAGRDFRLEDGDSGELVLHLHGQRYPFRTPLLGGAHQRDNLAAGMTAALSLVPVGEALPEAVATGLVEAHVPGRLEPVGDAPGYLVDVGHNPLAAAVVAEVLAQRASRCTCVLGMLRDKDAESVARLLAPHVEAFLCAGLKEGWRAQTGHELAERVRTVAGDIPVKAFPTVRGALAEARRRSEGERCVLVFGSFHTAAEAFQWLHERGLERRPGPAHALASAC